MDKTGGWFISAVFALLFWGLWGFFQKLATNQINPRSVYIFAAIGTLIIVLSVLFSLNFKLETNRMGVLYAVLAGLFGALGGLFFVHSVSSGKASIVITFTALYPVVTILLSLVILREGMTIQQGLGILFALISMVLLAK